jgi:hypothetical protein
LEFVASPALAPPEVQVDTKLMDAYNRELEQAQNMPLPGRLPWEIAITNVILDEDDADL